MPEQHSFNADGTLRRGSPRNREKVYRISLSSKLRCKLMAQSSRAAVRSISTPRRGIEW